MRIDEFQNPFKDEIQYAKRMIFKFWFNTKTNELIPLTTHHHYYVEQFPEKFGVTEEEIKNRTGNVYDPKIAEKIAKNKWVRGNFPGHNGNRRR